MFRGVAVSCLLFNSEDMRVLFVAVAGMLIIALSALVFQGAPNRQGATKLHQLPVARRPKYRVFFQLRALLQKVQYPQRAH